MKANVNLENEENVIVRPSTIANHKQRRRYKQIVKKRKLNTRISDAYSSLLEGGGGDGTPPQKFEEGDKASINIEAVKARKNYSNLAPSYQKFVEESEGKTFTVHIERPNMISFVEESKWLFWSGDLIKVENDLESPEEAPTEVVEPIEATE